MSSPVEAACFTVKTSKRGGTPRICARPLDDELEPWTRDLVKYFERFDPEDHVFPFTRQKADQVAAKAFKGYIYPIEEYTENRFIVGPSGDFLRDQDGKLLSASVTTERHHRRYKTHAIRHTVANELIEFYGFTPTQLSQFGGWTLRGFTGASNSLSRYIHSNWRDYFPKLLRRRT